MHSRWRYLPAHLHHPEDARRYGVLTDAEVAQLAAARDAVAKVVQVDDFAAWELQACSKPRI